MKQLEQTMSSVELVKTINAIREEEGNSTTLEHADFMKKVAKVLGVDAGNFSGIYLDSMNREKPCYYLPKREATLLAMSESYKVQATIYDRMTDLEQQAQKQLPQSHIEAVRAYLVTLEKVEEQQSQIKQQIETISSQAGVIDYKKIITADSEDYYPISYVKDKYPSAKLSGRKLGIASGEMDLPPIAMFASKGCIPINTYHSSVWFKVYPNYLL